MRWHIEFAHRTLNRGYGINNKCTSWTGLLRIKYYAKSKAEEMVRHNSTQTILHQIVEPSIVSVVTWYPILDFVKPRLERKAASLRPDRALSPSFTNLFDESYLPDQVESHSPYASPLNAPDDLPPEGLPHDIEMFICEWDMLYPEGKQSSERLKSLGKNVRCTVIPKAIHAWDRSPNPFRDQGAIDLFYKDACTEIKRHFEHA